MRRRHKGYYRHPHTTAEKRANYDREVRPYVRAKRSSINLPSTYDDIHVPHTKSWKDSRKTQYRVGGRGERHQIHVDVKYRWRTIWDIEEYFKDNCIPYNVERLYDVEERLDLGYWAYAVVGHKRYTFTRRIRDGNKNKYETKYEVVEHWRPVYGHVWKRYDEPRTYYYHHDRGYDIVWWSDKDIGMEHILKRIHI